MKENDTELTIFKPTAQMLKWLKSALDPEVTPTISAIAEDCSVNRENWYKWRKRPEFKKWWVGVWEAGMADAEWYLDKVGLLKATIDHRYWRDLQMKYHNLKIRTDQTTDDQAINSDTENVRKIAEDLSRLLDTPDNELPPKGSPNGEAIS